MAEAWIPVDLRNPGQVFACLGLVEATEMLVGPVRGGFDWADVHSVRFGIATDDDRNPVEEVLRFLTTADLHTEKPRVSEHDTAKWKVKTEIIAAGMPFPFPNPESPATLPAVLSTKDGRRLCIDYWGDATGRDNVKLWAGAAGYPGAALLRDALNLVNDQLEVAVADPFDVRAPQSSSFRLDWRRDYIPMDIGFSLNAHSKMIPVGYPLVEVLAAIGLTNARPAAIDKLSYRYGAIGGARTSMVDPIFLRAALGCADLPFPQRRFRMLLGWPGQEGQARSITEVIEEIDQ